MVALPLVLLLVYGVLLSMPIHRRRHVPAGIMWLLLALLALSAILAVR